MPNYRSPANYLDLSGRTFGRLTVLKREGVKRLPGRIERYQTTWLCRCSCGTEKAILRSSLRNGKTKSCGCLRDEGPSREIVLKGARAVMVPDSCRRMVLRYYKDGARKRGHAWELTEAQFDALTSQECYWCGKPPSQSYTSKAGNNFTFSGIDRVDNTKGYILDNCVSCCARCNQTKRDLSVEDFLSLVKAVYLRHIERKL